MVDIVGSRQQLVARRAHHLKDTLVHSEYTKKRAMNWLTDLPPLKGMYACSHCQILKFVDRSAVFSDADRSVEFQIKNFINCSTSRVIYTLECPCKKYYIGKTKRQLQICISEHIRSIKNVNKEESKKKKEAVTPLAAHFADFHGGRLDGLNVKDIYTLNLPPRRGDCNTIFL